MKNKILTVSIIFILISFIFINNSVFAVTKEDLVDVSQLDLSKYPSGYSLDNGYIMVVNNSIYDIIIMPDNFTGTLLWEGTRIYTSDSSNYLCIRMYDVSFGDYFVSNSCTNNTEIFYGTMNVYNSSGEVVFQQAPVTEQPETIPETVEIPAVETVEQIPVAMVETLKMIIPVGLVVLSVVLLIYLTRQLICRCS